MLNKTSHRIFTVSIKIILAIILILNSQIFWANDSTKIQSSFTLTILGSRAVGIVPGSDNLFTVWEEIDAMRSKLGFETGFDFQVKLSRNIDLGTGLIFSNRGYWRNYQSKTTQIFELDSFTTYIYENNDFRGHRRSEYFIRIPLYLGYSLLVSDNLDIQINAGISWNKLVLICNVLRFMDNTEKSEVANHRSYVNPNNEVYRNPGTFLMDVRCDFIFSKVHGMPIISPSLQYGILKRQNYIGKEAREMVYGLSFSFTINPLFQNAQP